MDDHDTTNTSQTAEDDWDSSHAIRRLLKDLRSDAVNLPERLAEFAIRETGQRVDTSVATLRKDGASKADLRATLVNRAVRRTVAVGAVVGGPFLVFIPVAFCAALLSQLRLALELGAAEGYSPTEYRRAADLLFLQGVHPSPDAAHAAMTRAKGTTTPGRRSGWLGMVLRMAYLLGILTKGKKRSRLRVVGGYVYLVTLLLLGMVAPLIWIPAMGWSYRQATIALAQRSIAHYSPDTPSTLDGLERASTKPGSRVSTPTLGALIRAVLMALVPLAAAIGIIASDTQIAGDRWFSGALVLAVLTGFLYLIWYIWRRRQGKDE